MQTKKKRFKLKKKLLYLNAIVHNHVILYRRNTPQFVYHKLKLMLYLLPNSILNLKAMINYDDSIIIMDRILLTKKKKINLTIKYYSKYDIIIYK